MKNYKWEARIIDEDNDVVVAQVSGLTEESMLEATGKSSWINAIQKYEEEKENEVNEGVEEEPTEETKGKVGELGLVE